MKFRKSKLKVYSLPATSKHGKKIFLARNMIDAKKQGKKYLKTLNK